MTLQDWVSLIKDIITSLAAIIAAIVAILGLQAWKKQLAGKKEYELAHRLLTDTYKFREALAGVRYWNTSSSESGIKAMYVERWQKVQEATIELDSTSLEAEAIWGSVVRENLQPLRQCADKLYATIGYYLDDLERPQLDEKEKFQIGFDDHSEDNNFSKEIYEAVKKMEKFLEPYLNI